MKSSDLPIVQFFSKQSTTTTSDNTHEMIEDIAEDLEEENGNDEVLLTENQFHHSRSTHFDDENSDTNITTCPVCQKMLLGDNDKINKHIDLCLNGEIIRTTIKEEDQRTSPQTSYHKRYVVI